MSKEGLLSQLLAHGIQIQGMKYGQQSVSVYQGTFQNYAAAIKILSLTHGADYTQLEKECMALRSLSHQNILKLYDCFWENNGVNHFFVIVTEWCEKDLAKDMKQRTDNHFPWREEDLWKLTFELVSALAYMQEQGISHRDIKPENIFMTLTKETKLGDFGSARAFLSDSEFATLTGTPFYLSPKLREAFINGNSQVVHNSFKSDVYSLGLTLLSLALLGPPVSLTSVHVSDANVQAVISTIPYSDSFKSLLMSMLSVDEAMRCDFKTLNVWLVTTTSQQLQFQVPMQKPLYGNLESVAIWCMQCHKAVYPYIEIIECKVVPLDCDPTAHMFCSRECCGAYISSGNFTCPRCGMQISERIIGMYRQSQLFSAGSKAVPGAQNGIEYPHLNHVKESAMSIEEAKNLQEATEVKAPYGPLEMIPRHEVAKPVSCCCACFRNRNRQNSMTTEELMLQRGERDDPSKDPISDRTCILSSCSCW